MRPLVATACFAGVGLLVVTACFFLAVFGFEYNRVRNLCPAGASRGETAHDAINAMRNYQARGEWDPVGRMLSAVRPYDAFKNDDGRAIHNDGGYRYSAGWHVEAWTKPLIARGYTVGFTYISMEFRCDVYDCGGIDIPNCLTMGGTYTPAADYKTSTNLATSMLDTTPRDLL
jgi:hypothetical protein